MFGQNKLERLLLARLFTKETSLIEWGDIFGCKNKHFFVLWMFWQNKLEHLSLASFFTKEMSYIEWGEIFGCKNQHFLLSCGCSGRIS
jgi:hypothetical protein